MNEIVNQREAYNLIQGLKKLGADDSQIVTFIEYIETSDPKLLDKIPDIRNSSSADIAEKEVK